MEEEEGRRGEEVDPAPCDWVDHWQTADGEEDPKKFSGTHQLISPNPHCLLPSNLYTLPLHHDREDKDVAS